CGCRADGDVLVGGCSVWYVDDGDVAAVEVGGEGLHPVGGDRYRVRTGAGRDLVRVLRPRGDVDRRHIGDAAAVVEEVGHEDSFAVRRDCHSRRTLEAGDVGGVFGAGGYVDRRYLPALGRVRVRIRAVAVGHVGGLAVWGESDAVGVVPDSDVDRVLGPRRHVDRRDRIALEVRHPGLLAVRS